MQQRKSLAIDVMALILSGIAAVIALVALTRSEFPRNTAVFTAQVDALASLDAAIELNLRQRALDMDMDRRTTSAADQAAVYSGMRRFEVLTQQRYHDDIAALQTLIIRYNGQIDQGQGRAAVSTSKTIGELLARMEHRFAEQTVKEYAK